MGGGAKSTMGIRNMNLRSSGVSKIDKIRLAAGFPHFSLLYATQTGVYKISLFFQFASLQIST